MKIKTSRDLTSLLWPSFGDVEDCVFLASEIPSQGLDLASFSNSTAAESFVNHLHVLDFFEHDAGISDAPYWDFEHPDFHAACKLGRTIPQMWAAKLRQECRGRSFRVYYVERDNPVFRFHTVRAGEPPWADEEDYQPLLKTGRLSIVHVEAD